VIRSLAVVAFLATSCSPATRRGVNYATLGAALTAITCDWGQTRATALGGWDNHYEKNPILGSAPSVTAVDLYMIGSMTLVVTAGHYLPEWLRGAFYGGVFLGELKTLSDNVQTGMPHANRCGLGGSK